MKNWKTVRLGEVLKHKKGFIQINDLQSYRLCRVQTSTRGIVLRSTLNGSEIKTKKQQVCKSGDFLVAEIDAKMGGYGIVPLELEGAIVSSHYFLYDIYLEKLDRSFLSFYIKTPQFFNQIRAEGSTNYSAIRPSDVLSYEIPLPPLAEQQRIVAKLETVQKAVEKVQILRGEQERLKKRLINSIFKKLIDECEKVKLEELLVTKRDLTQLNPEKTYKQITVRMQHKGVELRGYIKGNEVASTQYLAKEGDFIISKIDARNGAMGLVSKELNDAIVTNDFPLFSFKNNCHAEYFNFVTNTDYFDQKCVESSEGTTNRVRLKMNKFNQIEIPLPSILEQERIIEIIRSVKNLQHVQNTQLQAIEELLPSMLDKAFKGEV